MDNDLSNVKEKNNIGKPRDDVVKRLVPSPRVIDKKGQNNNEATNSSHSINQVSPTYLKNSYLKLNKYNSISTHKSNKMDIKNVHIASVNIKIPRLGIKKDNNSDQKNREAGG